MTNRKIDMQNEQIVADFVDNLFYSNQLSARHWERIHDLPRQYAGADLAIEQKDGLSAFIDEKTKMYPLNEIFGAYAHELQFINSSGEEQDGWFVKDGQITTHYAINTIFTKSDMKWPTNFCSSDINSIDILLYSKKSLMEYLYDKHGLDTDKLKQSAKQLRRKFNADVNLGLESKSSQYQRISDGLWLKLTYEINGNFIDEQPINLVISRKTLEALKVSKHIHVKSTGEVFEDA